MTIASVIWNRNWRNVFVLSIYQRVVRAVETNMYRLGLETLVGVFEKITKTIPKLSNSDDYLTNHTQEYKK